MKKHFDHEKLEVYQKSLDVIEIVSMLIGLVKSNSQDRVHEPQANYGK